MHNLIKFFLVIVSFTIFSGCLGVKPAIEEVKANKKLFENEDIYILNALYLEEQMDYNNSSNLFNILYKETDKKEYLYRSLRNDLVANENERAVKRVDDIANNKIEDFELTRIKIIALIKLDRLVQAKELATKLVEISSM